MKKLFFLLMITFFSFNLIGEENRKNTFSGGVNFWTSFPMIPGFNLEYERALNNYFSLTAEVGTHIGVRPYAEIKGRWYPWAGRFFVGSGLGVMRFNGAVGFHFTIPNIGLKIDIGEQNRWVIIPSINNRVFWTSFMNEFELWGTFGIDLSLGYRF